MKWIKAFLILALIGIIVVISGYVSIYNETTNPEAQKSYSDGSITFKYPAYFQNSTSGLIPINKDWIYLIKLVDIESKSEISVEKNENGTKPDETQQYLADKLTGDSFTSASQRIKVNPNGIKIFKLTVTYSEPYSGGKDIFYCFEDKKGTVYTISFYDYKSNVLKVDAIADVIFNSLKLN